MELSLSPDSPAAREDRVTSLLFVDEDLLFLESLERQFAFDRRWEVRSAHGAEAALAALAERPADVVLTDLGLTGIDGVELLRRVQTHCPRAVRIIHARHADSHTARRSAPVAHQFLIRPSATPVMLLHVLEDLRDLRQLLANDRLQHVVGAVRSLPIRPCMYMALTAALQDEQLSLSQVTDIIADDAGIAGRVLQLANSAFFGRSNHTSSLSDAVAHMGFTTVHSMVAACELFGALALDEIGQDERAGRPSVHLARDIGKEWGHDDAFTAALLRDLGVLVVRQSPASNPELAPLPSGASRAASREDCAALGFDYAQVGAYLLAIWGLPSGIVRGVLHQAEPWKEPAMALTTAGVIYVAETLLGEDALDQDAADRFRAFTMSRGVAHRLDDWRAAAALRVRGATEESAT